MSPASCVDLKGAGSAPGTGCQQDAEEEASTLRPRTKALNEFPCQFTQPLDDRCAGLAMLHRLCPHVQDEAETTLERSIDGLSNLEWIRPQFAIHHQCVPTLLRMYPGDAI